MATEAELDAWIARSWDEPPQFSRSVLHELFEDERQRLTRSLAEDFRTREVARLRADNSALAQRVARLEKIVGANDAKHRDMSRCC
jgi:hypothetical protein